MTFCEKIKNMSQVVQSITPFTEALKEREVTNVAYSVLFWNNGVCGGTVMFDGIKKKKD